MQESPLLLYLKKQQFAYIPSVYLPLWWQGGLRVRVMSTCWSPACPAQAYKPHFLASRPLDLDTCLN